MEAMKLFEMIFDPRNDKLGTSAWSFVSVPATDIEAVFLSAEKEDVRLAMNDDKQIMYAVGLVPNQKIPRRNKTTGATYEIVFKEETIKMAAHDWMVRADATNMNVEHAGAPIKGAFAVESWMVKNPEMDKAKEIGLTAPMGSWVLGFSVPDKRDWEALKLSGITGISMEGAFLRKELESLELSGIEPKTPVEFLLGMVEVYSK